MMDKLRSFVEQLYSEHESLSSIEYSTLVELIEEQYSGSGWLPIQSAPTDGSDLDVWIQNPKGEGCRFTNVRWMDYPGGGDWHYYNRDQDEWITFHQCEYFHEYEPTHWRPISPPPPLQPQEQESQQGECSDCNALKEALAIAARVVELLSDGHGVTGEVIKRLGVLGTGREDK